MSQDPAQNLFRIICLFMYLLYHKLMQNDCMVYICLESTRKVWDQRKMKGSALLQVKTETETGAQETRRYTNLFK